MLNENQLIEILRTNFDFFFELYYGIDEELDTIYLLYGNFGFFAKELINFYKLRTYKHYDNFDELIEAYYSEKNNIEDDIKKLFSLIDELYSYGDSFINDILNTCIFVALRETDYGYNLARDHLSKDAYNHFLEISKRVI